MMVSIGTGKVSVRILKVLAVVFANTPENLQGPVQLKDFVQHFLAQPFGSGIVCPIQFGNGRGLEGLSR
jgi:hypothetical protein